MIRAVLDTNVLVSALLNLEHSPSSQIFQAFVCKAFLLLTSKLILQEVERLIYEDRIAAKYRLSPERQLRFLTTLLRLSRLVPTHMRLAGATNDPDDDKFLACALRGKAEYLVSGDPHLLDLQNFHNIKIVTPRAFLAVLNATSESDTDSA